MNLYEFYLAVFAHSGIKSFKNNWHLRVLCDRLQEWATKDTIRGLAICAPKGMGVSTLVSTVLPVWLHACHKPEALIFTDYYNPSWYGTRVRNSRNIIGAEQEWLKSRFGVQFDLGSDADDLCYLTDSKGRRVEMGGADLSGASFFDYLIYDFYFDWEPIREAQKDTLGRKLQGWSQSHEEILSSKVLFIGSRQTSRDFIDLLRNSCWGESFYSIDIPMMFDSRLLNEFNAFKVCPGWKDPRSDGELLWSKKLNEAEFRKLAERLGFDRCVAHLQQMPCKYASFKHTDTYKIFKQDLKPEVLQKLEEWEKDFPVLEEEKLEITRSRYLLKDAASQESRRVLALLHQWWMSQICDEVD